MASASNTSQVGSSRRNGPVIVVLPVPLAPVTTNSGSPGSGDSSPQRPQRSRRARGSASRAAPGPHWRQNTSSPPLTPVTLTRGRGRPG
jgi:hypothetical protein